MKHFSGLLLWHLLKYTELIEVVRQNNKLLVDLLNKVWVGNIDDDVEKLLKARFIHESDENYSKIALHVYEESESAMKKNYAVLNDLPGKLYTIEVNGKITDNCKYPLTTIQAPQNQKQTGCLAKLLKLKIGVKMMLTVNLYIQDRLLIAKQKILSILNLLNVVFKKYM